MIIFHTKLIVADNSGARFAQCIKVLNKAYASLGNMVIVVVKELRRTIKQKKYKNLLYIKVLLLELKKNLLVYCIPMQVLKITLLF